MILVLGVQFYDLRTNKNKRGILDSGHYVTYWRSERGWMEINDASVRSVDESWAQCQAGKAYLLVYELAGYQGVRSLMRPKGRAMGK